jgi:hypothetical protein
MRVKAELATGVLRCVEQTYGPNDAADFHAELELLCESPAAVIERSRLFIDPEFSRFTYRWFPFGVDIEKVAIFHFDGKVVRVLQCRLSRPPRERRPGAGG